MSNNLYKITIPLLFEEQVRKTPENIALIYEDTKLTYRELNEKANQLAHFLKSLGLTRNTLVVIATERSFEVIISILGVLKAGGAYIPLDLDYSNEYQQYILENSQAPIILTNKVTNDKIAATLAHVIVLDEEWGIIKKYPSVDLTNQALPKDLAYVIYTSGTTGRPKGVMIEHESVVNYIVNIDNHIGLSANDKVDFSTSIGFDLTITSTICSLCLGSQVFIYNYDRLDLKAYKNHLIKNNINFIKHVPSYFELLIDFLPSTQINKIILGGEKLNPHILKKIENLYNYKKGFVLFDEYGPTESTIGTCYNQVYPSLNYNIGKAYDNYKAFVLNDNLTPLPIGSIGELYIGGVGVARGYLNKPELTAEKFIPNPFQTEEERKYAKNSRLYKTGDLVRWLPDGNLEYIGRNDFQVKIRGYRIEPEEIENVLLNYEGIKQCVVIAREQTDIEGDAIAGSKHLVVYYVSPNKLAEDKVLVYLRDKLPEYMVPTRLVHLDKLPLTVNGKLDRKALPEPEIVNNDSYIAPRNDLETQLCKSWSEVLGLPEDKISIYDDFFSLGGNSILAIRLVSKINRYFKSHIKVSDIFVYKCITLLLPKIFQTKDNYQAIIKLNNTDYRQNLFMIHPGGAGCEVYTDLANSLSNEYSCYGIDPYNLYCNDKIDNLHELANYYLSYIDDIMTKTKQKVYSFLGWSIGGQISLEIACILERRGQKNIKVYLLDTILNDSYLLSINTKEHRKKLRRDYSNYIKTQGYDDLSIEKAMLNMEIVNTLGKQKICSILQNTKVLLFKAILEDLRYESKEFNQYLSTLTFNNIDNLIKEETNLTMIKMNKANHRNILDQEQFIAEKIIEFNKYRYFIS